MTKEFVARVLRETPKEGNYLDLVMERLFPTVQVPRHLHMIHVICELRRLHVVKDRQDGPEPNEITLSTDCFLLHDEQGFPVTNNFETLEALDEHLRVEGFKTLYRKTK